MARKNGYLTKFGISHDRYMELQYFCRQYPDKLEKLQSLSSIRAINYTAMPCGGSGGNPTEQYLLVKEDLARDIKLIEQTAIEADSGIYQELIANVTQDIGYEYLDVPCGRRQFYKARQMFFLLLSKKK